MTAEAWVRSGTMTRVHAEGGSKSPREAWEEIEAVFGADPTDGAGFPLLVMIAWRARGFSAEGEHLAELSRRLGLEPVSV